MNIGRYVHYMIIILNKNVVGKEVVIVHLEAKGSIAGINK